MLVIHKYGGTSVGSFERIDIVAQNIKKSLANDTKIIVVASAMGKHTNELLNMAYTVSSNPPKREVDMLLTVGERISVALLSIALHKYGVKAISLTGSQCGIITDENHCNAKIKNILVDRVQKYMNQYEVLVVAGFQGVSEVNKEITTLGRGGSDLTAIALACALKASKCEIYTDVDGIYSADPNVVSNAKKFDTIDFNTVSHMAWAGAKVIHHRAADLALKYNLCYEIKSSFDFTKSPTLVCGNKNMENSKVQAIVHKNNVSLIQFKICLSSQDIVTKAIEWLWSNGENTFINQQIYDEKYLYSTQVVVQNIKTQYLEFLKATFDRPNSFFEICYTKDNLCLITLVGEGFLHDSITYKKVILSLNSKPYIIDIKNNTFSFCIPDEEYKSTLQKLHAHLVEER